MNKELYDDMIFASLYQSGVVQSPLSYYSLIPYNDILPIINKALSQQSEIIGNPKQVSIAITEILSNIGDKLDNIQKVFLKSSDISGNLNGTVTIVSEKSKEKEFVRLSVTMPDGTSKVGLYEKYYGDKYKFVPSKNYRTLFYNLSSEQEIENEEEDFIENVDESEDTVENNKSAWDSLSEDNKLSMTKAGISSEEFNSMTEKQKEITIDCYGLKK